MKKQKFAEPEAITWAPPEDGEETVEGDDNNVWGDNGNNTGWNAGAGDGWGSPPLARASKSLDGWGDTSQAKSSRVNAFINDGRASDMRRTQSDSRVADHQFVDSNGEALVPAQRAFYSPERLARDRIFWFFDPSTYSS